MLTIDAPPPTGISFANSNIYTWYGRTTDLGMTVTPAGTDRSKITWTQTGTTISGGGVTAQNIVSTGTGSAQPRISGAGIGLQSQNGYEVTLTARLPNGNTASVTLKTKFSLAKYSNLSTLSDYDGEWRFNTGQTVTMRRRSTTMYVRAYYGANEKEWDWGNVVANEMYLTKIGNTNYTITSSDPDITVTRTTGDSNTWTLIRTSASVMKAVTLTIAVGGQTYTQMINLVD
jgi:hypothetical protein